MKDINLIQSVAIIGASNNKEKLGFDIVNNLIVYKFKGNIYPINPKEQEILGKRVYKSILEINETIDLAIICIPAIGVLNAVAECVKKQVGFIIIISAGFGETGIQGKELENRIYELIKDTNTHIIGPNCLGVINSKINLNASFAASFPQYDSITFITQSGALGTSYLDWASEHNLGIDTFVSIGNKIDLDENYFLESSKDSKVVACYLENIKDANKFMQIGYKLNKKRPALVLIPGKSKESTSAISSHTGALAGDHDVISAGLQKSGYIEVNNIGDLFNKIKGFAWSSIPKDNKIAIVTNAGGPGVIATDLLIERGLSIAPITEDTKTFLQTHLPKTANLKDPIDVIGDALADRYLSAMSAVLMEREVSGIIVILTPQIITEIEKTAKYIGDMKKFNKPIIAAFIGGTMVEKGIKLLAKEKIPAYHFPETAIDVMASLVEYSKYLNTSEHLSNQDKSNFYLSSSVDTTNILKKAKELNQQLLDYESTYKIAKQYNIPILDSTKVEKAEEVLGKIAYPVVLKIDSPFTSHKTDIKGVISDIESEKGLKNAFDTLSEIINKNNIKEASIHAQRYIEHDIELFIGAKRDEKFGPLILFGFGGIYTEIIKDISQRLAPLEKEEIERMINETKVAKILNGIRGKDPVNINKLIETILSVSQIMTDYTEIKSIDINPLFFDKGNPIIVDMKIFV